MSVAEKDIMYLGCATPATSDTTSTIGGAVSATTKVIFTDPTTTGYLKVISSSASDTAVTITVIGRDAAGAIQTEVITCNGKTAVSGVTYQFERILKATSSAHAGTTAVFQGTATVAADTLGTGQGADYATLGAGATGTDDLYNGYVFTCATTGGTTEVREIVKYVGATKRAYVRDWGTTPTNGDTYNLWKGMVFDKAPGGASDILICTRMFYDAAAEPSGGSAKTLYEKLFIRNGHATLALTNAQVKEVAGGLASSISFGLETTLGGSGTTTNRLTVPASGVGTFDSADKATANSGTLSSGGSQGVWLCLSLPAGTAAQDSYYSVQLVGQST